MNKKLIRKMQTAAGGPINYKRWDNAKITSYTIPFIKEKAIKLTNAGRATGAVLSTNLLDSLADNAMRAGVPIRTAIGISTKETTLGNPTDTKSAWNLSSGIRREFNGKYPGTHLHINPGRDLNERELVINYHKGHLSDTDTLGKSVILEALEFYKQHPDNYNTNQSNYLNLVNIIGDEVMNSPEVLKWYREWEKSKAQIFKPEPYKINTNIQNTALEFIPHKKQGGKMNILEFLKNGSGIHIKKKNRGKFTSYCGGKVTDECIRKAKASGNPTLVKRATFADNARKWKHKEGGIIKSQEGSKVNWGKLAVDAGTNLLSTISKNKLISYDAQAKKALNQIDYDLFIQAAVNNAIQKMNEARDQWRQSYLNGDTLDRSFESDAVMGTLQHLFMAPEIAKGKQALNNANALADAEAKTLKGDNWSNMFGNTIQALGNYLGLKKTTSSTTTTPTTGNSVYKVDSFWTNPTLKTSTPTYSFNTPTLTPPKTNYSFLK